MLPLLCFSHFFIHQLYLILKILQIISKKNGGFIPGIRPGQNTTLYIDHVLTRLTVVGALYLSLVCILPEILIAKYAVPFYFGGTSLLIVVNVTMDTVAQIHSHLIAQQYEGLIKKSKLRGRI